MSLSISSLPGVSVLRHGPSLYSVALYTQHTQYTQLCMRVPLCVHVRVYTLRIVSSDKILRFKNTCIIIIINYKNTCIIIINYKNTCIIIIIINYKNTCIIIIINYKNTCIIIIINYKNTCIIIIINYVHHDWISRRPAAAVVTDSTVLARRQLNMPLKFIKFIHSLLQVLVMLGS